METKIFWCKVNKHYTDKWLASKYLKDKSGIFVASCVVTDKAKRKWIKFVINEIWKLKDKEKIYLSWCWAFDKADVDKNFYDRYSELEKYKKQIVLLQEDPSEIKEEIKIDLSKSLFTKKFIIIQNWCDSFCSFCLTVKKRWWHYSKPKEEILKEIINFQDQWWKEVVLTWVNLCAWWQPTTNDFENPKFKELIKYLLENTTIPRIRISSLWPEFLDSETIQLFKNTRIYPHFHFSLQSWSDKILKSMWRHYSAQHLYNILWELRNLKRDDNIKISIWADIIVWFPWETEEDFMDTFNTVKKYNITKVHAFPFSDHKLWENVPAWLYPNQIDEKIKRERLNRLIELWDKIRDDFIKSQIWNEFDILIESVREWEFKWWTQNYIEANNSAFDIIEWEIKRNNIVKWILKK